MKEERGAIGIGTLIVFIALVLVAAVAAAVLLHTSAILQERAFEVGRDATYDVSSKILILRVYGYSNLSYYNNNSKVDALIITVKLSSGSDNIDLNYTTMGYYTRDEYITGISVNDTIFNSEGTSVLDVIKYAENSLKNKTQYYVRYLISPNGDYDEILQKGEVAELVYVIANETGVKRPLPPGTDFRIALIPKTGSITEIGATTPSRIYDTYTLLYP